MKIWVDADACPVMIKEVLYRAADRTRVPVTLVANRPFRFPRSPFIDFLQVEAGFDVADNEIVRKLEKGDLVVTADIPLAAEVIEKGGQALNPRGEVYSEDSIGSRLSMRDFMDTLRGSGIETEGPPPMKAKDKERFANALHRILEKAGKNR